MFDIGDIVSYTCSKGKIATAKVLMTMNDCAEIKVLWLNVPEDSISYEAGEITEHLVARYFQLFSRQKSEMEDTRDYLDIITNENLAA